jgi:hypothetical protein
LTVDGRGPLARLICEREIDVVVTCSGKLQDGPGSDTRAHRDFVDACWRRSATAAARRLVHISIPDGQ